MSDQIVQNQILIEEIDSGRIALLSGWAGKNYAGFEARLARDIGVLLPGPHCFVDHDGLRSANFGQGRFLLIESLEGPKSIIAGQLSAQNEDGTAVDMSHGRSAFRLSGTQVAYVLNKDLALDLDIAQFPVSSVAQTRIDHMGVWIFRTANQVFELYVMASFAASFRDWLDDAALEFVTND